MDLPKLTFPAGRAGPAAMAAGWSVRVPIPRLGALARSVPRPSGGDLLRNDHRPRLRQTVGVRIGCHDGSKDYRAAERQRHIDGGAAS